MKIRLDKNKLLRTVFTVLLVLEVILVILDITVNYMHFSPIGSVRRLFNIAREDSLAAWIASVQTLFVGLIVWTIYLKNRHWGWGVIAAFFTYLAVDDGSKFHERIGTAVKSMNGTARDVAAESVLEQSYTWQYVFVPFFVLMGLFILFFMWRELKTKNLRLLIFAALSCYGLAVVLDFVEGLPAAHEAIAFNLGMTEKFVSHFGRVIEEFLELLGSTLFFVTFLAHFMSISPTTTIVFDGDK